MAEHLISDKGPLAISYPRRTFSTLENMRTDEGRETGKNILAGVSFWKNRDLWAEDESEKQLSVRSANIYVDSCWGLVLCSCSQWRLIGIRRLYCIRGQGSCLHLSPLSFWFVFRPEVPVFSNTTLMILIFGGFQFLADGIFWLLWF